jgi:hypothetical protein
VRWLERAAVAAAVVAWGLGAGIPILDRYRHFQVPNGLDQGYFLQRVWQAGAAGEPVRTLLNTEQGQGLIAARHFEPILALFVPLVAAWPDHRALLLGQLALLAMTLPAAWLLAREHLHRRQALLATWAVLGVPVLWQMEAHGFRTMALAAPLVAGTLWAASTGRRGWTLVLALGALSCREEVVWALAACLPWLWWWRGRTWRDTAWLLAGLCLAWGVLLVSTQGGPSTFWKLSELPAALASRWAQVEGAGHTSATGAAAFLGQWLGPGVLSALLAPLAALPLVLWWVGIQASSGLAGPEAVHLLGPALGVLCLVLPRGLSRLPSKWTTSLLVALVGWGLWQQVDTARNVVRILGGAPESPAGTAWDLVDAVPDDAALLTEARFLPAVAARAKVYATEDWHEPTRVDGYYSQALLREDHPWSAHLRTQGLQIVRVSPGTALWSTPSGAPARTDPLTPE